MASLDPTCCPAHAAGQRVGTTHAVTQHAANGPVTIHYCAAHAKPYENAPDLYTVEPIQDRNVTTVVNGGGEQ